MWECSYAREPFDLKLFVFRLLMQGWRLLLGAALGGVILGGGYALWNGVITGEKCYSVTTMYEVNYRSDPSTQNLYTYINDYTWNRLVTTDLFMDFLEDALAAQGAEGLLSEPDFGTHPERYLTADLPSDLRMPVTTVTTSDPELSVRANRAVQQAMEALGKYKLEIDRIAVADTGEPVLVDNTPRTAQAAVLGTVSGFFLVLFWLFCRFCMGEAVWIPETLAFRFGIPALGALATGERRLLETEEGNFRHLFGGKKKIAAVPVGRGLSSEALLQSLPDLPDTQIFWAEGWEKEEETALIGQAEGVLLIVEAGKDCGRGIMHCLETLKLRGLSVTAALLVNADRRLLNAYYFGRASSRKGCG